ncbi:sia-alpha-2,3-Gal-beta-1,4-GlcNAc-R:alpha 2,8-sialyltransferase-like [Meleagris gallopavo]|nr:sia-alpha-2,3-Gal-beta-1,4-GlcNAc-R:alpha 2,8-sialyltransferase-like [Meleagris gallopavo]
MPARRRLIPPFSLQLPSMPAPSPSPPPPRPPPLHAAPRQFRRTRPAAEPPPVMRNCKMVRVASVLGLVMLSIALLILSFIICAHISRSQFALKFLDPSFVPIMNLLGHELQEKPSKWVFNRTAFTQQKQEILQYVDVIKNFSLTKNSVQIGQLMHYDYSSHKYVFSISNNFRSLLPDVSPILNKHYNVCAVVGNSGILAGSQCGQEIDKSDFVFRCNFAPTEAFQKDVGRKINLTTFNPSILEKYYNNLLTIQDRNNFFLSLKKLDGAIIWIPAFFFHTSATVTRTLVDFFVEHRGQLKVQLAWPGNIMQHVNRYWKNKHLSPKRLSTGILMYTLASAICEEIHLYGFWPFGFDPNTREDLPYHYYDKKGTKFTTKWQESHQLPAEFQLLYRMHGEGLAKLTLLHCA